MNGQSLAALALRCGADKAALVRGQDIVLSEEFRRLCEDNACGFYGKCWMCPPDAGDIHTLMARVRTYDGGVLYQIVCPLEDSFDIEGMSEAGRRHALLSQKIQAALTREERTATWHLSCGGCRVCDVCAKREGQPCRFPDRAMLSLESCGVDVYNTSRATDLKYINGQNTVTFFGLLLYREEQP